MPDYEVKVPYNHPLLTVLRFFCLLSFPIWGVFAPFLIIFSILGCLFILPLGFFSNFFTSNLNPLNFLYCFSPICGLAFNATLTYLGIRTVIALGDKEITLNEKGISFPANFIFSLGLKRHRQWQDLNMLDLSHWPKATFTFKSGGKASINLKRLDAGKKEQLLLGLRVLTKDLDRADEIAGFLDQVDLTASGARLSYTKIWEDQMNSHFSSTAFVPLAAGTELQNKRIKIIGPIAFGGLSAVYLAQLKSAETVILKELVTDDLGDNETLKKSQEMFKREAEILMKLSDPRIARVLDHFVENGRTYIMLEYVAGENLRNIVRQAGVRKPEQAIDWCKQIASILDHIHSQDPPIIHRDLTPDNMV